MLIERPYYLNQLIAGMGNGLIKVVTGIRRCGKSFLLSRIFKNYLLNNGVEPDHIIHIPLDDRRNLELRNPDKFLDYVDSLTTGPNTYYLMVDEVQLMEDFVDVLNSLLYSTNVDVFVTGSNSKLLSKDIATEFRGRSDEIHMYPLSFKEFFSFINSDFDTAWQQYYTFGGLPQVVMIGDEQKKKSYLENLMQTVFIKDMVERNKIKFSGELEELIKIIASSIGSPTNPIKLSNTFKSVKKTDISSRTLSKYLDFMGHAFIIEEATRYNIKGKKYINTLKKYYFTDMGLRNGLLNFRQMEETHLMENIIFNELIIRGFSVDVGVVETREKNKEGQVVRKHLEIDFVANRGDVRYYIQSALRMDDDSKKEQEMASLKKINDSFRKIIVVRDNIKAYNNEDGYLIVGLKDFLMNF